MCQLQIVFVKNRNDILESAKVEDCGKGGVVQRSLQRERETGDARRSRSEGEREGLLAVSNCDLDPTNWSEY
ncbi:hypothetical protein DPX16_0134 [Anabarilius grahami]|uniref:Uncharacterized protein n=1 Tax=Anabarilius grahami TaxID=495550 RepID=A0A3N0YJ33_ANAGA|nr:hypothetical protein DPX16_0134 [Anabarilius grahami]